MTARYFDSINGSDSTGDGTIGNPWATYDAKYSSTVAGDDLYFKRGTVQQIATIYRGLRSGTAGKHTTYQPYGDGALPIFRNPSGIGNMILNGSNTHDIDISDIVFDAYLTCNQTIYMAAQSASAPYNISISRCHFKNSNGSGLTIMMEDSASVSPHDILIEDCEIYDNAAHGLGICGTEYVTFRGNKCYRNGETGPDGGHGISLRFNRTTVTSGWSGGGPYSRTITPAGATVSFVIYGASSTMLDENTSTPTNPGSGEFGQSGGVLYINIGQDPNGISVTYAFGSCRHNIVEENECYGNYKGVGAYWEGHGIALDDFASENTVRRNFCHDNAGLGFSINKGEGNHVYGNLAVGNNLPGIVVNVGEENSVRNNTFIDNNLSGDSSYIAEVVIGGENNVTENNIVVGDSVRGIQTNGTQAVTNNDVYGPATPFYGGTQSGNITSDPLLADVFLPATNSAAISGGVPVPSDYVDYFGQKFHAEAPSIGAVEMQAHSFITKRVFLEGAT